jgi:large subunit ribosomal protein L24
MAAAANKTTSISRKASFKKDDTVMVIAGRERGKTGKVVKVLRDKGKVLVERINVIKRHRKATGPQNPGGILEKEAPLDLSNVMLICPSCNKPTRLGRKHLAETRASVRTCKKCRETIDRS